MNTRRIALSVLFIAGIGSGCGLQAQTPAEQGLSAQVASLRAQLNALSAEVVELRLELQRQQIAKVKTEISRTEDDRAIIEQEQQIIQEETEDLSRQLADPLISPDQMADLRKALHSRISAGAADLRSQLDEVRDREHALASRLTAAKQQHAQTLRLREQLIQSNAR